MKASMTLMGDGKLVPTLTKVDFDKVPEGLEMLQQNKVVGRLITEIARA
jgi:propanol-preferring alcohol dehydrogenase